MSENLPILTDPEPGWEASGTAAQQNSLPRPLRGFHQAILGFFLDIGGPPERAWLAAQADTLGLDLPAACASLAALDLVHFDPAGQVTVAYPFSAAPTAHQVQPTGGAPVWAMCAIDALGIPLMTDHDATITATDPRTGEPVTVRVDAGRWTWSPPDTMVLVARPAGGVRDPGAADADCICPHINFVTTTEHARAYLDDHPHLQGALLDQDCARRLASAVFGPLLRPADHDRSMNTRGHADTRPELNAEE